MAKHLRSITEDKRLEGVKKSKVEDGEVYGGKDASVHQNDPSTVEFTKMHKIEKHDDRVGNDTVPYTQPNIKQALLKPEEKRQGNTLAKATAAYKAANEEVDLDEAKCNHTGLGTMCEVHGKEQCPPGVEPKDVPKFGQKVLLDKKKTVKEESIDEAGGFSYGAKKPRKGSLKDLISKKSKEYNAKQPVIEPKDQMVGTAKVVKEEESIVEVITKKTSVSKIISDFVHSKDPKFAGKSKAERQKMALGAYYGKHPEKSKYEAVNAVEPLLGEGGKVKKDKKVKESGPDGPIYPSGQVPNRTMDIKSDTGYNV